MIAQGQSQPSREIVVTRTLYQMALEVTLGILNVMPAQAPRRAPRHPRLFFSKLPLYQTTRAFTHQRRHGPA
jgi:hypothetical protein